MQDLYFSQTDMNYAMNLLDFMKDEECREIIRTFLLFLDSSFLIYFLSFWYYLENDRS